LDVEDAWHPEDALYAPLTASDGSRLGTLSVDLPADGRRPSSSTCRALEAFAVSAALAIEHAELRVRAETSERRFRDLASHDGLTEVGNRELLLERLHHALTRRAEDRLLAVVFIDLDRFKAVNDHCSHDAGDHVLKTVAARIQELVRPHDTVVRWGGDEFLVLLDDVESEPAALAVAQRITAAVAEPMLRLGQDVSVTASVGVAMRQPGEQIGVDRFIARADAAMYDVKRDGGNACALYEGSQVAQNNTLAEGTLRPDGSA
jgi:diguanylate cyclase (GGDEF)-like protein